MRQTRQLANRSLIGFIFPLAPAASRLGECFRYEIRREIVLTTSIKKRGIRAERKSGELNKRRKPKERKNAIEQTPSVSSRFPSSVEPVQLRFAAMSIIARSHVSLSPAASESLRFPVASIDFANFSASEKLIERRIRLAIELVDGEMLGDGSMWDFTCN